MSKSATPKAINFPWTLALLAMIALLISKSFERPAEDAVVSGEPPFVGPPSAPEVADNFLLRAAVSRSSGGSAEIGNVFAVRLSPYQPPLIVTALHRFGPAGGFAQLCDTDALESSVEHLALRSAYTGTAVAGIVAEPIPIPSAGTIGTGSEAGDIAAFTTWGTGAGMLEPAELATDLPQPGSGVWLAIDRGEGQPRSLRASVFSIDPAGGLIYYRFPPGSLTLAEANANTGAPIIGLGGDVFGIHVGAASDGDPSALYGLAQSSAKFLPYLLHALQGPPSPEKMASTALPEPE